MKIVWKYFVEWYSISFAAIAMIIQEIMALFGHHMVGLSPAYDVLPISFFPDSHCLSMEIGAYGKAATLENAVSKSEVFGLSHEDAMHICKNLEQQVHSSWENIFLLAGVPPKEVQSIAKCFLYEADN